MQQFVLTQRVCVKGKIGTWIWGLKFTVGVDPNKHRCIENYAFWPGARGFVIASVNDEESYKRLVPYEYHRSYVIMMDTWTTAIIKEENLTPVV